MAVVPRPDLCIVGAGALGIALALHARHLGANVVLADRGQAEPGDLPQQQLQLAALGESAALAQAIRQGSALGLANEAPKLVYKTVQEHARSVAASRAPLDAPDRLTALGVELIKGPVRFVDGRTLAVGDLHLRPRHVVLATGARPSVPDLPGLKAAGFFTADTILDNVRKLTHLVVIGASPAGLELAQAHLRLGSEVTVVPHGGLLPEYDPEAVAILLQALRAEGLRIMDGAGVVEVLPRSQGIGVVTLLADGSRENLDASHILVTLGRTTDVETLDLDKVRLRSRRGGVGHYAQGSLGQTSNRWVRVVGAAAGLDQWHHALAHGRAVVESLLLSPLARVAPAPRLVMTEPALAQIGRSTAADRKLRPGTSVVRVNLAENDRARARGRGHGEIKVLADEDGRILGASAVGPEAGELAGVLALAMELGLPLSRLAGLCVPHPSFMGSLVALGENHVAQRPVSPWKRRQLALRRLLPW